MRYFTGIAVLLIFGGCVLLKNTYVPAERLQATLEGPSALKGHDGKIGNYGRVNALWVHPHNPDFLLAASPHGGLWITKNRGRSWKCLTDTLVPNGVSDFCVLLKPRMRIVAANSLYTNAFPVKRYTRRIIFSDDTGKTWQQSGLRWPADSSVFVHAMAFQEEMETLWAATDSRVFYSKNRGMSWKPIAFGASGKQKILEIAPRGQQLLISGMNLAGVYHFQNQKFQPLSRKQLPVSYRAHAVWQHNRPVLLHTGISSHKTGILKLQEKKLDGVPHSWQIPSTGRDYILKAGVAPSGTLYAGGIRLYRLKGNRRYERISNIHADVRDLAFSGDSLVFIAHDGGVSMLRSGQTKATLITGNMNHSQVYSLFMSHNGKCLYAGCHDAGLFLWKRANGWEKLLSGDAGGIVIARSHPDRFFAVNNKQLWYSANAGKSWQRRKQRFAVYNPPVTTTKSNALVFGNWNLRTTGARPADIQSIFSRGAGKITAFAMHEDLAWVATRQARNKKLLALWKGQRKGKSWRWQQVEMKQAPLQGNEVITAIAMHPRLTGIVWIGVNGPGVQGDVLVTKNGGEDWYQQGRGLAGHAVTCLGYDEAANALWAGTIHGLFLTRRNEVRWKPVTDVPRAFITDLEFYENERWIATYGRGVWRINYLAI